MTLHKPIFQLMTKFIVVGGGPVGCLAALQLAKHGHHVTIYEGRHEIPNDPEQSYPIGVNPRGLHAIESVAPDVAAQIRKEGRLVDAWDIYAGPRRVAHQPSGVVYGTSRGAVNLHLWRACEQLPDKITLVMCHRLRSMDFNAKTLTFDVMDPQNPNVKQSVVVNAEDARIIAADGVHSTVRTCVRDADSGFLVDVLPWTNEYRVLFGIPGKLTDEIDPAVHYIFTGGYTAVIDNGGQLQWTLTTTVRDADSDSSLSQLVHESEATEDNIAKLKKWIDSIAPAFAALVPEQEWSKYFSRRTYRGAVVHCNRFHFGQWVVLLGDAAHSVLPPTGEGINSGMEDTFVLSECLASGGEADLFERYTAARKPDIQALFDYASHLNTSPTFAGERIARLIFLIVENSSKTSIGENLFGPSGAKRLSYRKIVDTWRLRRAIWLNLARLITYPLAGIAALISLPFSLFKAKTPKKLEKTPQKQLQGVV
ncbi:unnamed protein product [Aphanomyces euteiches]